jgi:xanthine phosphoribosyltransferase
LLILPTNSEVSLHEVTWPTFDHDVGVLLDYLARHLKKHKIEINSIAAITRGGLFPAGLIAYAGGENWVDTICIKSRDGTKRRGVEVLKGLHPDTIKRAGEDCEHLLIVDDLADDGDTIGHLRHVYRKATFVAPYVKDKPDGLNKLDAWAVQIPGDTWFSFVWSKREPKPQELIAEGQRAK